MHVLGQISAGRRSEPRAIAGIRCGRKQGVVLSGRTMAEEPMGEFVVRGKAASGEDDAAARGNGDHSVLSRDDRTRNASIRLNELDDR